MSHVHTVINELSQAFEDFKQMNDDRLRILETKKTTDPLIEESLTRLQRNIDYLEQKQRDMMRPQIDGTTDCLLSTGESKAFSSYLRSGDDALLRLESKSLTRGADEDGGFFVPQNLGHMVDKKVGQSTIRTLASVMTVSSDHVDVLLDREAAAAGWVAETANRPETDTPKIQKKRINVHEIYAKPRATQKLLDDANIDVDKWLTEKISQQFSDLENHAFLNGDGVSRPRGILSLPVSTDLNPAFGTFRALDSGVDGGFPDDDASDLLVRMIYCLRSHYLANASWMMSRSALQKIRMIKDSTGNYLWQPSLSDKVSSTLLGFPVYVDDAIPGVVEGTASSSVIFGDVKSAYQIVDRSGIQVLRDPFSSKPFIEFYSTKRVGGDVVDTDALAILRLAS
ncbi:MAG: phage major capsid protein [Alphaproteobacteria bacterium]|nr:MAG: phage major capsid protein [Alphaproteobacteria bacterium]